MSNRLEILLPGHIRSFTGRDARRHISASIAQIRRFKADGEHLMREEHGDLEALRKRIKAVEWDDHPGLRQPEPACRLNLAARQRHSANVSSAMNHNHWGKA